MERKEAVKLWREVSRGAPDGVPTGRMLHEFAQRVEERAIAACDARHRKHEAMFALGEVAAPDLLAALELTRGQWIHSVNAPACLAAIAAARGCAA